MGSEAIGQHPVRVRDVVREVVAQAAPEEVPVVDGLARYDDATVVRRLRARGNGGRSDPLGFGLGEIAVMAAPVVWLVLDQAAREFGTAAADGAAAATRRLLDRVLRRRTHEATVPALTAEQLAGVHRQVLDAAARRGLETERAEVLADAVVARLALTAHEAPVTGQAGTPVVQPASPGDGGAPE